MLLSSFTSGDIYIYIHPKELRPMSERPSCARMLRHILYNSQGNLAFALEPDFHLPAYQHLCTCAVRPTGAHLVLREQQGQ